MAYDLAMNIDTHDLILRDGDLMLIDNAERVAQQIKITLCFWYGEWFLDTTDGTPYLEHILVKNPNISHVRQIIADRINSVEGVTAINDIQLNYNAVQRTLDVEYSATTDYGLLTRKIILGYNEET